MRAVGVLLCAGSAARMGFDKLTAPLSGKSAIERSMRALLAGGAEAIVFAVSARTRPFAQALPCPVERILVTGGDTRHDSVLRALKKASECFGDCIVLIHDAARCLVSPATVAACLSSAERTGSGVAAVPIHDTVLRTLPESGGMAAIPREGLYRTQTPQAFRLSLLLPAYERPCADATDDATVFLGGGHTPTLVMADEDNFKLTTAADWARAERLLTRYGTGFDTHRLAEGRALILGGVRIPHTRGLLGHSDADVLTHAIMDALLGAASLPDIGHLFPNTDPAYAGADSIELLRRVVARLDEKRLRVHHIHATVIAERPKLSPYLPRMSETLAAACRIPSEEVALSATTTEGMNDEGRGLCISARAIASLR